MYAPRLQSRTSQKVSTSTAIPPGSDDMPTAAEIDAFLGPVEQGGGDGEVTGFGVAVGDALDMGVEVASRMFEDRQIKAASMTLCGHQKFVGTLPVQIPDKLKEVENV